MNRYRRGASAIVPSRLGLAHVGAAQLKVENPPPLRTIGHLIFARVLSLQGNAFYSEILIKKSNRRYRTGGDTNIARKKSAQRWREGFHRRERRRGVRLRKRHQKKKAHRITAQSIVRSPP